MANLTTEEKQSPMIRLENERRARGMSQKTLGGLLGLHDPSASVVSRWENGTRKKPQKRHALKLEEIFGLTVDQLFAPADDESGALPKDDAARTTRSAKNEALHGV